MDKKELKSIARFYKDCEHGFATEDGYYAIPIMGSKTQLMVLHEGEWLKKCRNELSARNYIKQLRKKKGDNNQPSKVLP